MYCFVLQLIVGKLLVTTSTAFCSHNYMLLVILWSGLMVNLYLLLNEKVCGFRIFLTVLEWWNLFWLEWNDCRWRFNRRWLNLTPFVIKKKTYKSRASLKLKLITQIIKYLKIVNFFFYEICLFRNIVAVVVIYYYYFLNTFWTFLL